MIYTASALNRAPVPGARQHAHPPGCPPRGAAHVKSAASAPPPPSIGADTARGASAPQFGHSAGDANADIGRFAVKPPQLAQS